MEHSKTPESEIFPWSVVKARSNCLFDTWMQMYHRESGPRGSQTVPRHLSIVQARPGQGGRL